MTEGGAGMTEGGVRRWGVGTGLGAQRGEIPAASAGMTELFCAGVTERFRAGVAELFAWGWRSFFVWGWRERGLVRGTARYPRRARV